jgi:serine O-acetyltransferase
MNAIRVYRLGHRLHRLRVPILPRLIQFIIFFLYNSSIPPQCEIGDGSTFGHGCIGVVLNRRCRIGRDVMIGQNTTIGGTFGSGVPVIGDNVYIAAGSRILGDIVIGNNVIVGANAVVLGSVADNTVVAGAPARAIARIPEGGLDAIHGTWQREGEHQSAPNTA